MPATFLATDLGPIEPNIYYLFEAGAPQVRMDDPPGAIEEFLMGLWDHYGKRDYDELLRTIRDDGAFALAYKRGADTEITVELMGTGYGGEGGGTDGPVQGGAKPAAERVYWTPPANAPPSGFWAGYPRTRAARKFESSPPDAGPAAQEHGGVGAKSRYGPAYLPI